MVLTGLSGSGKSTVLRAFEDMGYYCVDNLPVELMPIFAELHAGGQGDFAHAALLVDAREGSQLEKLPGLLRHLRREHPIVLVFGLSLSVVLMGIAASFIARLLQKYRWMAYIGLAVILYVAIGMVHRGALELRPIVGVMPVL